MVRDGRKVAYTSNGGVEAGGGDRVSISNLASTLNSQGKYNEAEAMNTRVLERYEKAPDHPARPNGSDTDNSSPRLGRCRMLRIGLGLSTRNLFSLVVPSLTSTHQHLNRWNGYVA